MSNAIYPTTLPGLSIDVSKTPEFSTLIARSVNGKESRMGQMVYPLWNITLSYNFLRDSSSFPELKTLGGFFLSRQGQADSFLLSDPDDKTAAGIAIGVGDGTNRDFQLVRAFGTFVEPVFSPDTITAVQVGASSVGYTLLANGVVRLDTAPAAAAVVTWTGTYYFRCRFLSDKMSLEKFLHQIWKTGRVALLGSLQDKI